MIFKLFMSFKEEHIFCDEVVLFGQYDLFCLFLENIRAVIVSPSSSLGILCSH
jgi:hypothetical protein